MNRIGLKVNGIWCVLPQDVSISIEEQNPLFSDSGSFSYPIELSISQNRELFKSIDSPHGRIRPQHLDGLPFELWYDGVMLLYGSTETDEDLDIDEDKCSINLVSGNGDFQSKIDGMQCTDVPLMDKVELGRVLWGGVGYDPEPVLKYYYNSLHTMSYDNVNVSYSYKDKQHPFCNVRLCVKRTDEYNREEEMPYWVYEADRPWSGVCFYVAYFLDCLFAHLGMVVKKNDLENVDDMMRLAFFTTKCEHELGEEYEENKMTLKPYAIPSDYVRFPGASTYKSVMRKVYATNKNFPETDINTVIKSLFNAFGVKIVNESKKNELSVVWMRDILRDSEVVDCNVKVNSSSISYEKVKGVRLTYGGDEKDTAYHYNDWDQVEVRSDYKDILACVSANNETCYVMDKTGNKYRIKVDETAVNEGKEEELYPSLFEVMQFADYVRGEDVEDTLDLKIEFTPVIENEVVLKKAKESKDITSQRLAIYMDVSMKSPGSSCQYVDFLNMDGTLHTPKAMLAAFPDPQAFDEAGNHPFLTHDSGFTLGVMRGPGSEATTQVYLKNYDGNGNDAWTTVVADYAFTADTMDAYGNRYDYNGTAEGGIADQANSISLKTHIQTAQDLGLKDKDGKPVNWGIDSQAAKRGLADRFMSEYMHFLLNRKTVNMEVDTTLSQITSLSWFKQLRINDTVGRLKSRSYTLSNSGVSDMSIKLYTIN